MKYWLKGGIFLGFFGLILGITGLGCIIYMNYSYVNKWNVLTCVPIFSPVLFFETIFHKITEDPAGLIFIHVVSEIILGFAIGAVMGLIYGKFKKHNKK